MQKCCNLNLIVKKTIFFKKISKLMKNMSSNHAPVASVQFNVLSSGNIFVQYMILYPFYKVYNNHHNL